MKNSLLLLALIACCGTAEARHPSKINNLLSRNTPDAEVLRSILTKQMYSNAAMKSTGTEKRLKGHTYIDNGVLKDTTWYVYSYGRGSSHPVNSSYYNGYSPMAIDNKQYIFCDSSVGLSDYSGQGNLYESIYTFQYDSKNNVIDYTTSFSTYVYGYVTTYNSNNQPLTVTISDRSTGTPVQTSKMYAAYNGQGQRIMDSTYSIQNSKPVGKRIYTYDMAGNKIGFSSYQYKNNQMELTFKTTYTYDNNNRILTSISEIDFGAGMEFSSKDSFAYTGTATQYTHFSNFDWDNVTNEWMPEEAQDFILTSQGFIDTYYIRTWNGNSWDSVERDNYVYSNGLLQYTNGFLYTGNGTFSSTPYDQMTYYYEEYDPTGISSKIASHTDFVIYPNPASSTLQVKGKSISGNISISSINGQTVYKEQYANLEDCRININDLPSGSYILNIQDAQGLRIHQQLFTKQ